MEGRKEERNTPSGWRRPVGRSYAEMEAVASRRERDAVAVVRGGRRRRRSGRDAYAARWRTPGAALNEGHGARGRPRGERGAETAI
jgi:hypothetical protein